MQQETIGSIIYAHRKQRVLTQEQLAQMVGVSPGAVSKWENGASLPDIGMLKPLARALDISVDTLLGFEAKLSAEELVHMKAQLTDMFLQQGYEAGVAACRSAVREYPNSAGMKVVAAQLMQMYIGMADAMTEEAAQQMEQEAMALYRQVQDSGDALYAPVALYAMAGLYMGQGAYTAAEDCLKTLPADQIDPYTLWPMLLLRQENWREAEQMSQRCLLYHATMCSNMLHTCAQARIGEQAYEKALFYAETMDRMEEQLGIGLGGARLLMAQIRLQAGEYESAAQCYEAYVRKLVAIPYMPYVGNPYFETVRLSVQEEGQKAVRLGLYRALLEETDPRWAPIQEMPAYQNALQLLHDALRV